MINNSESVKIGLTKIQSGTVFHCYEHIVKRTRDAGADVVIPTHIEFDRLDLVALNYTFEIYIANQIITSVSNELINDNDIEIKQERGIL